MSTVPDAERTQPLPDLARARSHLTAAQSRRFGGIRWGSAFFGWVIAMTMTALFLALAGVAGTALGLVGPALDPAALLTTGIASAVVLLVAVLAGYYCGGYVAGRMARFAGARQGVAVWLWTLLLAVVAAVAAALTGALPNLPLDELFRFPMSGGVLSAGAAALVVGLLVVTLVGAVLGGLAGMRYHRRVDRDLVAPAPVAED
ncbi:hypothetical protein [Pseudonocardia zijingensis]|uniref:Major facilitator superfamily (MFS) profile domain-containing protein n=1 Tax=Pseudonocardia zijingensis TaxID=153376 RepID=A0ABP3YTC8_9PSEU